MHRRLKKLWSTKSDEDVGRTCPSETPSSTSHHAEQTQGRVPTVTPDAHQLTLSSTTLPHHADSAGLESAPQPCHESPYGLKELVGQPREKDNAVDIITIHGLNGHREKTWTDKTTNVNWLCDETCLPKDIPNARVLSFGYNSASYFSRYDSDVRDFASELLAAVRASRKSYAEKHRPIVFICHSLGGLVFKQVRMFN